MRKVDLILLFCQRDCCKLHRRAPCYLHLLTLICYLHVELLGRIGNILKLTIFVED